MTSEILIGIGFGIIGGVVRIAVESIKSWSIGRFSYRSFLIYSLALLIISAFAGLMFNFGKVLSFLGGYAGIDLMEGFYTAFKKQKIKVK